MSQRTMHVGDIQPFLAELAERTPTDMWGRELTVNACQGVERAVAEGLYTHGNVVWDFCDATVAGVTKLRICDDGIGMTAEELSTRVGSFAAVKETVGNFGIGAKVSLPKVSPAGVVYYSMRDRVASTATYSRGSDGSWGMETDQAMPMSDADVETLFPEFIRRAGHGTAVVLLGARRSDPSVTSFKEHVGMDRKDRWLMAHLNGRFTSMPEYVTVSVKAPEFINGGRKVDTRTVKGLTHYLDEWSKPVAGSSTSAHSGQMRVYSEAAGAYATLHWWLQAKPLGSGQAPAFGHVRVVSGGEVYHERGGSELRRFGVSTSTNKVEIHLVLDTEAPLKPSMDRGSLTLNGRDIGPAMADWSDKFRAAMPEPIAALVTSSQSRISTHSLGSATDHFYQKFNELGGRRKLLTVAGARRKSDACGAPDGTTVVVSSSVSSSSGGASGSTAQRSSSTTSKASEATGTRVARRARPGRGRAVSARLAEMDHWAPKGTDYTSDPDEDLAGHVAVYTPETGEILINETHELFQVHVRMLTDEYAGVTSADARIEVVVRRGVANHLVDTITGVVATAASEDEAREGFSPGRLDTAMSSLGTVRKFHIEPLLASLAQAKKALLGE